MKREVLQFISELENRAEKAALVTITEVTGSSPASVGQIMAVSEDGKTQGTVGGGASEHYIIQKAVQEMQKGSSFFSFSFKHDEKQMSCGGGLSGFGNIFGTQPKLIIFGGGHIAQKIAPIAVISGFDVTVVEERHEFEPYFTNVNYLICDPHEYAQKICLTSATYVVICTYGHKMDDVALRFCLNKPLAYIGMIGSKQKVLSMFEGLRKENVSDESLQQIYAPIGIDIADNMPGEIAVAILAEILYVKNGGSLRHKKWNIC